MRDPSFFVYLLNVLRVTEAVQGLLLSCQSFPYHPCAVDEDVDETIHTTGKKPITVYKNHTLVLVVRIGDTKVGA